MKTYAITVTSECISAVNNSQYNCDKIEGQNELKAETARAAIEKEIRGYRLAGNVEWFDDASCVVTVDLEDGNQKHFFFDAAEI